MEAQGSTSMHPENEKIVRRTMAQTNHNQDDASAKEVYHSPQLGKLGKVVDLTFTSAPPPFSGSDGGSFPNMYAS